MFTVGYKIGLGTGNQNISPTVNHGDYKGEIIRVVNN